MALQQLPNFYRQRLIYGDTKGSGLLMVADPLNTGFSAKKTLIAGRLTDAARTADTELVLIPGARIRSLDSNILYESNGSAWVSLGTGTNDDGTSTATQMAAILAGGGGGGGSGGVAGQLFTITEGGSTVVTSPGLLESGTFGINYATVRKLGSAGSYSQSGHAPVGPLPPLPVGSGTEVIVPRYTTDGGSSWTIGMLPGESIGTWAIADLLALNATTYDGCVAKVTGALLNVDGAGTARPAMMVARGGRWRWLDNIQLMRQLSANTAVNQSQSHVAMGGYVQFPIGLLQIGDELECWYAMSKTGIAGTTTFAMHLGDTGDSTDTAIYAPAALTGANLSYAFGPIMLQVVSATSVRIIGNGSAAPLWNGTNAGAVPSATSLADNIFTSVARLSFNQLVANAADQVVATACKVIHRMAP